MNTRVLKSKSVRIGNQVPIIALVNEVIVDEVSCWTLSNGHYPRKKNEDLVVGKCIQVRPNHFSIRPCLFARYAQWQLLHWLRETVFSDHSCVRYSLLAQL